MIIKDIYIDGFGVFRDYAVEGLESGVNVILGNNEAGKSTLLKFIRFTLFGYPRFHADRMAPLYGGSHGGRITGRISSGEEVIFDRKGNEEILITYRGNSSGNQSLWDQLLGHAHRELYNNIYSFTLDELTGIGSLDESGMQDKIYSIGMGLGKRSIGDIADTFAENADTIYKKRGRTHTVATIMGEIEKIHERISTIRSGLPEYQRLEREIDEKQVGLAGQREQLEAKKMEKNRLEIRLKCYESFLIVSNAEKELKTLPASADYPENGPEEIQRIEQEWQGYHSRIIDLEEGSAEEPGIAELEKRIRHISFNEDLLADAEKVDYLKKMLEAYKLNFAENEKDRNRVRELEEAISTGISDINSSWAGNQVMEFTDITIHRDRVKEFRDHFESIADRKRTLEAKADALRTGRSAIHVKAAVILISVFLLCGSALLFFYRIYVPGGITLLLALLTFFSRKYLVSGGSANLPDQQIEDLRDEEKAIKQAYGDYLLQKLRLTPAVTPDGALRVLDQIESLKKEMIEQQRIMDRMNKERTPKIAVFESEVMRIGEKVSALPKEEGNMEVLVHRITEEFENAKRMREEKLRLEEDLGRKRREYSRIESAMDALEKRKQELFAPIGAGNQKEFLERYAMNSRVRALQEERKAAVRNIEVIAGQGKSVEVIQFLEQNEKGFLEQEVRELTVRISEAEEEQSVLREQVGKAKNELERIEGQSELAESLTSLETQKHLLQSAYKEWLVNKTARKLLEEVKGNYEKEKQPELIKSSGVFLERITSARYNSIHVSMDDRDILVSGPDGAAKRIEQLSRGTREQLMISLRLGLIREYERKAEPLPVVVDEVLVNFDPQRAKQVAAILQEFAAGRQILVFTCHPSTARIFDQKATETVLDRTS